MTDITASHLLGIASEKLGRGLRPVIVMERRAWAIKLPKKIDPRPTPFAVIGAFVMIGEILLEFHIQRNRVFLTDHPIRLLDSAQLMPDWRYRDHIHRPRPTELPPCVDHRR